MHMTILFLSLFAGIAVLASIVMLTRKTALGAAISLVVCFLAFAGLYVMLSAPFVAVMQVVVYAGAIMMLIVFVIMTVDADAEVLRKERATILGSLIAAAIMIVGIGIYELALHTASFLPQRTDVYGTVTNVGSLLFTHHVLNFEMLSLLLLIALVGALILTKQNKKKTEAQ